MDSPGEKFRRIRVHCLVLAALCQGLDAVLDRVGDDSTDGELIGEAQTEFNLVIANRATDLCEAIQDAESLGIMDALETAAWGLPHVTIVGAAG
ncbi:MAG: hypothetical protein Q8K20_13980 [Gemmobacter sp.]|nr:hypothetical protein [Gemmobacter sp.]